MTATVTLCFLMVSLLGMVTCIDPSARVSFARVYPNALTNRRSRRTVTLSPSAYTEDEKKEMLDAHNGYRRTSDPPAADMNLLTWNVQLADSAQSWAEQCIWDHGQVDIDDQQYDPMGQNLWRGGNKVSVSAVNAWANEYRYFTHSNHSCEKDKKCGHYTQVVWGDTKEVGCGFHSCEDGGTIVACNYGPAGNYNRQPYIEGDRCSKCASPGFCYDGLCTTQCYDEGVVNGTCECAFECQHCGVLNETSCTCECKAAGWHGDQCENVCEDTHKNCYAGWYRAQCGQYSYVDAGCPAMCRLCVEPTAENAAECPCEGKMCKNGGELNTSTCTCNCPEEYSGDVCETVVAETTTQTAIASPTVSSVCGAKTCQNNGVLMETCECECSVRFTGLLCGDPPVGSANIPKSFPVYVITMAILLSHLLGTWYHQ